jgi:MFS family permease
MTESDGGLFRRDFCFWLAAKSLSNVARKMLEVALAWQIYEITRSPLALGLIGLAEAVPFLGLSLWAGHLVDRHEKKPFMMAAGGTLLFCALVLFGSTFRARPPLALLYAVIAVTGMGVSFGSVASSVYLQMMVPEKIFSRAAAWNLASFTTATIAGPVLAGGLLSVSSARVVYALSGGFFVVSLFLTAALRFRPGRTEAPEEPALLRIREGVRFVMSRRILLACMCLDMVAVLFGDAVAIFPVFAELLKAGPFGFGVLRAAPAVGSSLISLLQAARPFILPTWSGLKKATLAFGLFMIAFALSKSLWMATFFLILSGVADGFSVIIRQSLYQSRTPDHLRGRVASLSGIFVSTSNEIGAFESGLAARLMGAVPSVVFGGAMTLLTVLSMGWIFRDVRDE